MQPLATGPLNIKVPHLEPLVAMAPMVLHVKRELQVFFLWPEALGQDDRSSNQSKNTSLPFTGNTKMIY